MGVCKNFIFWFFIWIVSDVLRLTTCDHQCIWWFMLCLITRFHSSISCSALGEPGAYSTYIFYHVFSRIEYYCKGAWASKPATLTAAHTSFHSPLCKVTWTCTDFHGLNFFGIKFSWVKPPTKIWPRKTMVAWNYTTIVHCTDSRLSKAWPQSTEQSYVWTDAMLTVTDGICSSYAFT